MTVGLTVVGFDFSRRQAARRLDSFVATIAFMRSFEALPKESSRWTERSEAAIFSDLSSTATGSCRSQLFVLLSTMTMVGVYSANVRFLPTFEALIVVDLLSWRVAERCVFLREVATVGVRDRLFLVTF